MANEQRGSSGLLATQTSIVHGPNKSIKRDLRENTGFKLIIGRVGPLFQALGGKEILLSVFTESFATVQFITSFNII